MNFHPRTFLRGATQELHVTERLTLQPNGDILYRFTMDDPATWETPWSGEYILRNRPELVYEYACHEGNYAMGNTLQRARVLEADAAAAKAGTHSRPIRPRREATGVKGSGDQFDPEIRADLPPQYPVDLGVPRNRAAAIVSAVPPPGMPSPLAHQLAALSSKMPQKGSALHVATTTFSKV